MIYKVEVGDLSGRVKGEVGPMLSSTVEGAIVGASVYDESTGEGYGNEDFPVDVPLGHQVSIGGGAQNTGIALQHMVFYMELRDPDGTVRVTDSLEGNVHPGNYMLLGPSVDTVVLDKRGTWVLYARLDGDLA